MTQQEDEFALKLGHVNGDARPNLARVRALIAKRKSRHRGQASPMPKRTGVLAHVRRSKGKGFVDRQRVIVKVQFSLHGDRGRSLLKANLAYVARGHRESKQAGREIGVSSDAASFDTPPEHKRLTFYDQRSVDLDTKTIAARWADDPLHFRIVISPEYGEELGSLRPMVREVMTGLELKLGTNLTWLAIDHWDTPAPHTHVLVRGMRSDGLHLYIPRQIMFYDTREHAQEVVTRILGPRSAYQLRQEYRHEIGFTPLDRQLMASRDAVGIISSQRPDLLGRLEQLEDWGFAQRGQDGWRISRDLADKLNAMSSYRSLEALVIRQRQQDRPILLLAADASQETAGQLVHAGIADVFDERFTAVIETGAGEYRYHPIERSDEVALLQDVVPLAEISLAPITPAPKPLDHAIAAVAQETGGLYSAERHLLYAPDVSSDLLAAGTERLAAMSEMSLIAPSHDGDFVVGQEHLKRAMMYESRLAERFQVSSRILSFWTLEDQVSATGPTRLDRILAGLAAPPRGTGAFARRHAEALQQRRQVLIDQGWLRENESVLPRAALTQMAAKELQTLAVELSSEIGKPVHATGTQAVQGVYARRIDLAQGRVALIIHDQGGHLVPWRPSLEAFAGRHVSGLQPYRDLSQSLQRGLNLPPM